MKPFHKSIAPLPSPSTLEDIPLRSFPQYLPLRPDKPSRLRTLLRRPIIRASIIVFACIVLLTGITLAAVFVGNAVGHTRHARPTETIVVTPQRETVTVLVTRSSAVTSSTVVAVMSEQSTAMATATVSASAG
jgi:hypothetical protein